MKGSPRHLVSVTIEVLAYALYFKKLTTNLYPTTHMFILNYISLYTLLNSDYTQIQVWIRVNSYTSLCLACRLSEIESTHISF